MLDFAERLVTTGFCVATFRISPEDEVRYGLLRDVAKCGKAGYAGG
jgi:hypothetical protein